MKHIIPMAIVISFIACSTNMYKKRVFEDHEPRTPHQKCMNDVREKLEQCHYKGIKDCFPDLQGYNGPYDICYKGE